MINGIGLGDSIKEILSDYLSEDDMVNSDSIISDIFAEITAWGGEFEDLG
jgi:hypothetical protein